MSSAYRLINANCLDVLKVLTGQLSLYAPDAWVADCIFADPPDNIGLKYGDYSDNLPPDDYFALLRGWVESFLIAAPIVWISFNARWWSQMGRIVTTIKEKYGWKVEDRLCVQPFTFGQHRQSDLGNNYRPLLRLRWTHKGVYPDQIRVPSWRQQHGDKRADPRGKVPGDVFDFPRVTGNSRQRRRWCKTQLHEELVERCIKLSTKPADLVLDPFAGSGTTMRVCKRIGRRCITTDVSPSYCTYIAAENDLEVETLEDLACKKTAA
jgi:site-specific DNA-methyltransferase (adenine-specific)